MDSLATVKTLRAAPKLWLDPRGPLALPLSYLPRLAPWLVRFVAAARPAAAARHREALHQLNQAAVPAWERCLDDLGAGEQLVRSGYLLVWENPAKRDDALAHSRYLSRWDISSELVEGERLRQLEPNLSVE